MLMYCNTDHDVWDDELLIDFFSSTTLWLTRGRGTLVEIRKCVTLLFLSLLQKRAWNDSQQTACDA